MATVGLLIVVVFLTNSSTESDREHYLCSTTQAQAGLFCPANARLEYDGPTTLDELWADPQFRLTVGVRVQRNRVMRTRPRFEQWAADAVVHFDDTLLNKTEVLQFAHRLGESIGLGDWRPKFGRFRIEDSR